MEAAFVNAVVQQYLAGERIIYTEAARAAGYKDGPGLAVQAARVAKRGRVAEALQAIYRDMTATRNEALAVVAAQMRGQMPTKRVREQVTIDGEDGPMPGSKTTETYDTFAAAKVLVEAGQPQAGSVNVFGTANIMLRNE